MGSGVTRVGATRSITCRPHDLGNVGVWEGGEGAYSPVRTTQIGWWDPTGTSNFDGKQGAWESCDDGEWFAFLDPQTWAPDHTQLSCFGR